MMGLGTNELLIIGGIIVVLFGGSKPSQLGKGLGEGIREFRSSLEGNGGKSADTSKASETMGEAQSEVQATA